MKCKKLLLPLLILLVLLGTWLYVNDAYAPLPEAAAMVPTAETKDWLLFSPEEPTDTGLIFYPGGKVEPQAYSSLMQKLADEGLCCVLLKMPCNLAVLKPSAAQGVPEAFPDIQHWYLAGHSLGGSMAASFAAKHPDFSEGLILLAAYSTAPVENIPVLSLRGSEDGVLNLEKYEKYRDNLPADCTELVLEGGNHAFFGTYGPQKGDGTAAISPQRQQEWTAAAIGDFLPRNAVEKQLDLLYNTMDTWKVLEEQDGWCYAVTDLDGNGRLEILSSETHGSGCFTTFRAWEVNEDLTSLLPIAEPGEYGSAVIMGADTYSDPFAPAPVECCEDQGIRYYLQEDGVKDGAAHYYETKLAVFLKDGRMNGEIIATRQTNYLDGVPSVFCQDGTGMVISTGTYEYAFQQRFAQAKHSDARIGWITTVHTQDLTRDLLAQSWQTFGCA